MTTPKEEARQRTEMLTALRSQHSEAFKQAQAVLKEQQATRKSLQRAMAGGAKSVPQLAESTGIPAHTVLWHLAAMKKYGQAIEAGMDTDSDDYLYVLSQETKP